VANAIPGLASEEATFVNASAIMVDDTRHD